MGVDIDIWLRCLEKHPSKYKFKGFAGWHTDVREAAIEDEKFMDAYMKKERDYILAELAAELKEKPPEEGKEDDFYVESYADFLRRKCIRNCGNDGDINHSLARKVIETFESLEEAHVTPCYCRQEWAWEHCDPEFFLDAIMQDDPKYYLKDHPPVEMFDHASEEGVPINDVYFICPGCGRHPVREEDVKGGHFYCGLCGAESILAPGEPFEKFIESLDIELWPFHQT